VHRKQRLLAAGIEEEEQGAEEAGTSPTLADLVNQSSSSSSSSGSGSGSGSSAGNSAGNSAQSPSAAAAAAKAKNGASLLSQSLTLLIQLQNHVNCYMDSAKDPNPLGGNQAQPGIRQILERKEGLFRKNMMGKRVNYCCRSVISPDPYIGTNEVGLPLHFAKSLHYPEPVNEYNVKRLRALVERGPFKYPGKCRAATLPCPALPCLVPLSPCPARLAVCFFLCLPCFVRGNACNEGLCWWWSCDNAR
jgi:hypothetical protein